MRILRGILAFCALLSTVAAGPIPTSEYRTRRAELRKNLDGTLVLFARTEGRDEVYRVDQDHNFLYLTGWSQPGAILLMTPSNETLFLPRRNPVHEEFTGRRLDAADADAPKITGVDRVLPVEKFEATLAEAAANAERVYASTDSEEGRKVQSLLPMRRVVSANPMMAGLRMKKSPAEIDAIRHTTQVSMDAHRAAWRRVQPGSYEYQAAAVFTGALLEAGCEGNAYSPIVGSGPNSTVLHYSENRRRMDAGETIVIDAAAQCDGYTSDITRTLPVAGKWTPRQKEIYSYVLGAQNAVIAAIKPGVELMSLSKIAREYLDGFKDEDGKGMAKYLTHGVSHHVGLDVHDATAMPSTLVPGMVITVEPGLYIKKENIGIRIEDVVLVTEKGAELLSGSLPREADEIEKAMAR